MMPLYHAVAHGCKAGLWQEALDAVYHTRIVQFDKKFSMRKLGAFGTELSTIAGFFEHRFQAPISSLILPAQAWVLNQASFRLRALGRLSESREPMAAGLVSEIERHDYKNASVTASNLSELSLTLGDVSSTVRQGEQSVELADRSGDAFQRMVNRTTLAAALHASGRMKAEG
jgi:hypothetical protein